MHKNLVRKPGRRDSWEEFRINGKIILKFGA